MKIALYQRQWQLKVRLPSDKRSSNKSLHIAAKQLFAPAHCYQRMKAYPAHTSPLRQQAPYPTFKVIRCVSKQGDFQFSQTPIYPIYPLMLFNFQTRLNHMPNFAGKSLNFQQKCKRLRRSMTRRERTALVDSLAWPKTKGVCILMEEYRILYFADAIAISYTSLYRL